MGKMIKKFCKTIGQFLCCQFVVKVSRELFQPKFIEGNISLSTNQSDFCPLDSCENQLISKLLMISILFRSRSNSSSES